MAGSTGSQAKGLVAMWELMHKSPRMTAWRRGGDMLTRRGRGRGVRWSYVAAGAERAVVFASKAELVAAVGGEGL